MKVLVTGAGKLGSKLAAAMVRENMDVTVIDWNENVIKALNDRIDVLTVTANAIDFSVYRELEIETYDLLIAATDSDEVNTIVCTVAKKLGCKQTIARIRSPYYLSELDFIKKTLGITAVVNPELSTANSIAKYLMKTYDQWQGDYGKGRVHMVDFAIGQHEGFVGKTLAELPHMERLVMTAILRHGEILIPSGNTVLEEDDVVHLMGESDAIKEFHERYHYDIGTTKIPETVMIIGGGRVGVYLARRLIKENIEVTIIEKDAERCDELTDLLDNRALIIHGDGSDLSLLEEESIHEVDAFVAATGIDEVNLLMSSLAKQEGVPRAVAKVSRASYEGIIDRLSLDAAFNPVFITAANILKGIRGGRAVSVTLLLGGEAEVTEVVLHNKAPVVGKKIKDLRLPEGILIGTIIRDGHVIIPKGDTELKAEDSLVLFSLSKDLETLKNFFIYQKDKEGGLFHELRRLTTGDW